MVMRIDGSRRNAAGKGAGTLGKKGPGKGDGSSLAKPKSAVDPFRTSPKPAPKLTNMDPFRVRSGGGGAARQGGGGGGAYAPNQNYYGGGGGGMGIMADAGPAPKPQSENDWLEGDSSYQAQLAALIRAAEDSSADFLGQRSKYDIDYNDSLKGLGWQQGAGEDQPGAWNFQDLNTAAGRAQNNQINDFASRGLLQSSLYGTANDNLLRSLNDQLTGINTGRQTFLSDLGRQETSFKNENAMQRQQAKAEALARRAAEIGL
jgi:hypothetical protein